MPTIWNPITKRMEQNDSIVTSKKILESSDGNKPNNGLHGVVTPLDQKLLKRHGNLDIYTVANNPILISMFAQFELPNFISTSDGIYFEPIAKIINGTQSYFIKWFCLRSDFTISVDNSYDYARVFTNGYLMKIVIPRSFDQKTKEENVTDFNIQYLTPCSQFDVTEVSSKENIITYEDITEDNNEDNAENDSSNKVSTLYKMTQFDPNMYPEVSSLFINKDNFIDNYLQDIHMMMQRG